MFKKVLIIGTHRSGTTNLLTSLSEVLDLKPLEEPWNKWLHGEGTYKYPDILPEYGIIKTLLEQIPPGWSTLDFYIDLTKKYSNVILLTRRDRVALAESYARQMQFGNEDWHTEYIVEDTSKLLLDMEFVNKYCDMLLELSNITNIPITWYEDLYSGNKHTVRSVVEKWGLDLDINSFIKYVNPKNRYRKFTNIELK